MLQKQHHFKHKKNNQNSAKNDITFDFTQKKSNCK
nr:MAG TPA: hypothetical protein [Caudoviricetes sp.]